MKKMFLIMVLALPFYAGAHGDHDIVASCVDQCPKATSEEEVVKCADGLTKDKKTAQKFKKSQCFAAVQEHKKEKHDGHQH